MTTLENILLSMFVLVPVGICVLVVVFNICHWIIGRFFAANPCAWDCHKWRTLASESERVGLRLHSASTRAKQCVACKIVEVSESCWTWDGEDVQTHRYYPDEA